MSFIIYYVKEERIKVVVMRGCVESRRHSKGGETVEFVEVRTIDEKILEEIARKILKVV